MVVHIKKGLMIGSVMTVSNCYLYASDASTTTTPKGGAPSTTDKVDSKTVEDISKYIDDFKKEEIGSKLNDKSKVDAFIKKIADIKSKSKMTYDKIIADKKDKIDELIEGIKENDQTLYDGIKNNDLVKDVKKAKDDSKKDGGDDKGCCKC